MKQIAPSYQHIQTFEDACEKMRLDPTNLPEVSFLPEKYRKFIIAAYKLGIIYEAINQGWQPDWSNYTEQKYFPSFEVISNGFALGWVTANFTINNASKSSFLFTHSLEKARYISSQFKSLYEEYFLNNELDIK